jgi:cell division septum initiation protein DivIVA
MAALKESHIDECRTANAQFQREREKLKNRIARLKRELHELNTANAEMIAGLNHSLT